ncbi:MAG: aspartyl/glutamyl-tRNA amidotransferase subunit C [Bdellovibrionales bacterium]|nr:aspartyl/glutamyl-tRNA amidotransferase subunit C [Bdellovibrionales bacterium]
MEITDKVLKEISELAALKIKEEEKVELKFFLKEVLSYFEKIKSIESKKLPALVSPLKPPLCLRSDKVLDFPDKDKLLEQASKKQGALIKTPPSI